MMGRVRISIKRYRKKEEDEVFLPPYTDRDFEVNVMIESLFLKPEVVFHEVVDRFKEMLEEKKDES